MTAPERHAQTILARLAQGPARFGELEAHVGIVGAYLRGLLDEGQISRVEINNRVWVYYPGNTAPVRAQSAKPVSKLKAKTAHKIPVRKVTIQRSESSFSSAAVMTMTVTLPAEPWA